MSDTTSWTERTARLDALASLVSNGDEMTGKMARAFRHARAVIAERDKAVAGGYEIAPFIWDEAMEYHIGIIVDELVNQTGVVACL